MKNFIKKNWFNFLTVILLLVALSEHPYAYFQFLRWIVCIIAIYDAYNAYHQKQTGWSWVFGVIAILFNPIASFYLSKFSWQGIDFVAAIIFFISIFNLKNHK